MRNRTFLILAAVVVALAAYIGLHERHLPTTGEVEQAGDRVFPGLERDQVTALEISNQHGVFRLEREDDGWRLTEPLSYEADSAAVNQVLGALVDLKAERTLEVDEADPAELGLEEAELDVELHLDGGESYRLEVGAQLPLGSRRPVRRSDGEVVVCSSAVASGLDRDLEDWRSRDVVDVFSDQVVSVEMECAAGRAHAAREEQMWRLLEPVRDLADRDHISSLVADLNALEVQEFADGADPSEMGLETPRYALTLIRKDGREPILLEFGDIRELGDTTVVACRRGGAESFWVGDGAERRLDRPPVLWRSRAVYPFDSWSAESLTLASEDRRVEMVREAGLWRLADGGEADTGEAASRLTRLADLEATALDLVDVGARELGRVELGLRRPGDDEAATKVEYVFFASLQDGGDAAVRVTGREGLLGVGASEVEQLLGDLDALFPEPEPAPDPEPEGGEAAE